MECEPLLADDQYSKQHKAEIRRNFIRKVLGIVSVQVIITVIAVYMFMQSSLTHVDINWSITDFLSSRTFKLLIASFFIYFAIAATLCFCNSIAKKVPTNYILLLILTICTSFMLAVLCQFYQEDSIINALLVAVFVTCGLTGFTFVFKKKLGLLIGTIVVFVLAIVGLLILYLVLSLNGKSIYEDLYVFYFLGVFAYGLFLVFDIDRLSRMKCGETVDKYIFAALMIYFDVVNLFLELLRLAGQKKLQDS